MSRNQAENRLRAIVNGIEKFNEERAPLADYVEAWNELWDLERIVGLNHVNVLPIRLSERLRNVVELLKSKQQ